MGQVDRKYPNEDTTSQALRSARSRRKVLLRFSLSDTMLYTMKPDATIERNPVIFGMIAIVISREVIVSFICHGKDLPMKQIAKDTDGNRNSVGYIYYE